jgi:inorganic pyrophosphatase
MNASLFKIIIENPKGSHKVFVEDGDTSEWRDYPLKGVTYPVDYGYIEGYKSEDGEDLDIFVGSDRN